MKDRGVRIVKKAGNRSNRNVDVYDLETGEKILNVYRVHIDVMPASSLEAAQITLTTGDAFEYEGPAEFVTPEETDGEKQTIQTIRVRLKELEETIAILTDPDELRAASRGKSEGQ